MFINKNSIYINNISMGQYLLQAKFEYNKLWGKDTGRNLAGKMSGTLIGIFPKLTLTFRKLTTAEMNVVAPILDSAEQTLTYYDPTLDTSKTITTYTGDWNYTNKRVVTSKQDSSFECAFISKEKR